MLLSFHIKNYRSILDAILPMRYAEKKAPNGYREMELFPFLEVNGVRTVPCLAIYGANASGKSTIILAFESFVEIIRNRYDPKLVIPNRLHPGNNSTSFILEFMVGERIFRYVLEVDRKEIVTETLTENGETIFSITDGIPMLTKVSTEGYPEKKLNKTFLVECLDKERLFRTPFITVIGKNYAGLHESMTAAFDFMSNKLEVHSDTRLPFSFGLDRLANTDDEKEVQRAFEEIASILRKLDIDITRMEYKRDEVHIPMDIISSGGVSSYHKDVHGNEVRFDFTDESAGTRRVARLLCVVLAALRSGTVLVVDELGTSLHPILLAEIVRMFKDKRYNTSNAQLIFTTHNTDIMEQDMMRVSEIGFVNKTKKKGSTFSRVSEFKGIRNVTNFRKQYLQGSFSGIPHPYI